MTCPYCGKEVKSVWTKHSDGFGWSSCTYTCEHCGREFTDYYSYKAGKHFTDWFECRNATYDEATVSSLDKLSKAIIESVVDESEDK